MKSDHGSRHIRETAAITFLYVVIFLVFHALHIIRVLFFKLFFVTIVFLLVVLVRALIHVVTLASRLCPPSLLVLLVLLLLLKPLKDCDRSFCWCPMVGKRSRAGRD